MPPDDPLFSVVTISFNQGEFLARAIESVLEQDARIQYIVCDPGSTDGSRGIIDSYGGAIAERVYERDEGPADGLNRGFARATGDIYAYLNSDDTFLPGAFARIARYFAAHPDIDVVTGHCLVTDRHDRVLRRAWSEPYHRHMVAYGLYAHFQTSTFIRAEAFRRTPGFNPGNVSSWDSELLMELFLSGARIRVIDEFLSTYRLHSTSITNTGAFRSDSERFQSERFVRLMGRERRSSDDRLAIGYRFWKRLRDPRAALERLLRGPITMRGVE
jgi:glycosyltransferase involved in cell wall biosynthesis